MSDYAVYCLGQHIGVFLAASVEDAIADARRKFSIHAEHNMSAMWLRDAEVIDINTFNTDWVNQLPERWRDKILNPPVFLE